MYLEKNLKIYHKHFQRSKFGIWLSTGYTKRSMNYFSKHGMTLSFQKVQLSDFKYCFFFFIAKNLKFYHKNLQRIRSDIWLIQLRVEGKYIVRHSIFAATVYWPFTLACTASDCGLFNFCGKFLVVNKKNSKADKLASWK